MLAFLSSSTYFIRIFRKDSILIGIPIFEKLKQFENIHKNTRNLNNFENYAD